jgi:sulfate permease, SulP family
VPVRRAGLLAFLQFGAHNHHGHLRHLAVDRLDTGHHFGWRPSRFSALAAGTAILVGLIAFIAWLIKAGSIINFISESVMIGFKCGVAFFLASTQLPKLFGIPAAHGDFWENSGTFLKHLNETNLAALTIGGTALVVLVLGKLFLKKLPISLLVVVVGIVASRWLGLDERGVKLLGEVPQGLPDLGLPALHWEDLNAMLPLALACFLLAAVETAAIGRTFAAKYDQRLDANQEFLALGVSNLGAGFGQGFPISGGMSQSVVNEGAGARTPLSGAIAAVFVSDGGAFLLAVAVRVAPTRIGGGRVGGGVGPRQSVRPQASLAQRRP